MFRKIREALAVFMKPRSPRPPTAMEEHRLVIEHRRAVKGKLREIAKRRDRERTWPGDRDKDHDKDKEKER